MNKSLKNILLSSSASLTLLMSASNIAYAQTLIVPSSEQVSQDDIIKDIRIKGLNRVEKETVTSYLPIRIGDKFEISSVNNALKSLHNTGLFADISIRKDDNNLFVNVIENPVVNQRVFEGNNKLDDDILAAEISLHPRSIYTKSKVRSDVNKIIDIYKRSGRYTVSVEPKIIERDQNRIDLIYEINEGPTSYISKINFIGNSNFSDDDLKSIIMSKESRWYRFMSSDETYNQDRMTYDKELLKRFYKEKGFVDFSVKSAIAELQPNKESFYLTFTIDEGQKYELENFAVKSNLEDLNTDEILSNLDLEVGKTYDARKIENAVQEITETLGNKGFAFVDVNPKINKDINNKVSVEFIINEGLKTYIDEINIAGNVRTLDKVIRRELEIDEGDAFNTAKLRKSRNNIEDLHYFNSVNIKTEPSNYPDKTNIKVDVEEKPTGAFSIGAGWSSINGPLLRTGISENNLLGKGQKINMDMAVSGRTSEFDINFTEPYFMDRKVNAGFDIFKRSQDYQDESSYDKDTAGFALRSGWKYSKELSHDLKYVYTEDEISDVDSNASNYIKNQAGKSTTSMISQTFTYDKRNRRSNPTDGYFTSFGFDVAGLGGDNKFVRPEIKAAKYFPIGDESVFKIYGDAGYVYGYGSNNVNLTQRYQMGGYDMRGFSVAGIGARDSVTGDALGGNWKLYTGAEANFPIGLSKETGIKGKLFTDVGMLGKPDGIGSDVDYSSKPRVSVGTGLIWDSPMGQINLDIAFPVVKEDYDDTETFRVNFGTKF